MRILPYIPNKDYKCVSKWIDSERTHAFWCANRLPYPITQPSFHDFSYTGSAFLFRGTTEKAVWKKDFLYRIGKSGFFNKLFYVYITSFSYIYTKFSKKTDFPILFSKDVTKPYYIRGSVHRYFRYEVQFSRFTD